VLLDLIGKFSVMRDWYPTFATLMAACNDVHIAAYEEVDGTIKSNIFT